MDTHECTSDDMRDRLVGIARKKGMPYLNVLKNKNKRFANLISCEVVL